MLNQGIDPIGFRLFRFDAQLFKDVPGGEIKFGTALADFLVGEGKLFLLLKAEEPEQLVLDSGRRGDDCEHCPVPLERQKQVVTGLHHPSHGVGGIVEVILGLW